MPSKTKGILAFIGATLAGSGIPVFSKLVLKEIGPEEMMTIRFLIAWLVFLPFVWRSLPKKIGAWLKISLATLPAAINMVLFANGVQFTTATMAQLIYSLSPIAAAVIVFFIGQEKLGLKKISGIIVGLIGMMILIITPLGNQQLAGLIGTAKGNSLLLIGMVCWTIYTIASKALKFPPQVITSILLLNGFLINLLFGGFKIFTPEALQQISLITWLWIFYLSLICSIAFFLLYQVAIKYTTAVTVLMMSYLQPVLTFIWAAVLLGERLSPLLIIAGGLTLTGAYLTTTAKRT
ncbi:MAG: DMT family transporter [bacterium]|nr:DMT family transporter [bacterium]